MLKSIINFLYSIINYVLPERKNFSLIKNIDENTLNNLPKSNSIEEMPWIEAIFHYKDSRVKAIIWELKYKENTLLLDHIGKIMYEEILALIGDIIIFDGNAEFLLIPVPITNEKRIERGYNQSEYIAKAVLENDLAHNLIYAPQWFQKIKNTAPQSHSGSREERMKNLLGSFEANQKVAEKYVILIDDVVTTGSTFSEAKNTLMTAGAKDVFGFAIAH